jgi:putative endonuclease
MDTKKYFVYIVSNFKRTTLYIGITNDLARRITDHRSESIPGFTARYHLTDLIYFEEYTQPIEAIKREKQLKGWRRSKKEKLITHINPTWNDLSTKLI